MRVELDNGARVGSYEVKGVIGRGGMGVVYLAEHVHLARPAALKVISPDLADNKDFRDRFVREYRLAAAMDHPNIVDVYDAGEDRGILFIAMRYVRGTDLRTVLDREHRLDLSRAASILAQVAGALDAAHGWGLVHRDVKPANILLESRSGQSHQEHCWLSDFGLVKGTTVASALTQTGAIVGTLPYTSPEQIRGEELDGRSDLYSLAVVFYQCLTGAIPFAKDSEAAVIYAHLAEPPPPVSVVRGDVPTGIDEAIQRAMAKSRDERYETCSAFAEDVAGLLSSGGDGSGSFPDAAHRMGSAGWSDAPTKAPGATETARGRIHATTDSKPRLVPVPTAPPPTLDEPPAGRKLHRRRVLALSAAAILLLAAGLLALRPLLQTGHPCPARAGGTGEPGLEETRIAFVSDRDGNEDIYVTDPTGDGARRLTNSPLPETAPAWSPDGTRIAFVRGMGDSSQIFSMSCDGGEGRQLTSGPLGHASPAWSPDGSEIAFVRGQGQNADIFVMGVDGSGKRNISKDPDLEEMDPVWSPDGTRIAFVALLGGNSTILVMDADGGAAPEPVPHQPGQNVDPAWFETQIAFSSTASGNSEIYSMNENGTRRTALTLGVGDDVEPDWAPDGSQIVFESNRDGNREIYVMDANGNRQRNVTNSDARDTSPAWSPRSSDTAS